jgi:hypothetical protein
LHPAFLVWGERLRYVATGRRLMEMSPSFQEHGDDPAITGEPPEERVQ